MPYKDPVRKVISAILVPAALCLMLAGCRFAFPSITEQTTAVTRETTTTAAATTTTEATTTTSVTESSEMTKETSDSSLETTTTSATQETTTETTTESETYGVTEDGEYSSKDEVALYIHLYGHLPSNFITKKEAKALGWRSGSLEPYAPGKSIGGDRFGNYEGNLPEGDGIKYTECDIDTVGKKSRGAKRIVFSNDGHIYYTEDHYETFILLYGD